VTSLDSIGEQPQSCAERWKQLLDWLDFWFQPEKAEAHGFDAAERELFDSLAPAWLAADPGAALPTEPLYLRRPDVVPPTARKRVLA